MQIILNGKEVSLTQEHSVESLLASLDIKQNNVAVEINCNLVPRSTYSTHLIADGDKIEIIHFVGGG
jgi:thiamine biosynthesis protein ThiS